MPDREPTHTSEFVRCEGTCDYCRPDAWHGCALPADHPEPHSCTGYRPASDGAAVLSAARDRGHDDVIGVLRAAARHPHKGPNDTDVSMLLAAATRLRGGYEPGGSNTKQTVAKVIEAVASLIDEPHTRPADQTGDE